MVLRLIISSILFVVYAIPAQADILFEGYAKILSGDEHIGYIISRYEFDQKKKQFISTYFLRTGKGASNTTESLKAYADSELAPISYEYTALDGSVSKLIDAQFKNGNMKATVTEGKKVSRIDKKISKGTFLSTFLIYLMLKSKEGLRSEANYEYQAIAEEDGAIHKGQALVGKEEMYNGFKTFKILNTFKDIKFLSYVDERGEVLATDALGQGIKTELVATSAEAIGNIPFSAAVLKTLFGDTPKGESNVVSRKKQLKIENEKAPAPGKQLGIPGGQSIIIKAQPENTESKGK